MSGELWTKTAIELATALARGEASSAEIVDAHIARIEAVNPALNAMVADRFELARGEARAADAARAEGRSGGALAGVPISVKDSQDVAGMASTFGLPSRKNERAASDGRWVARLREAGAIVLGKTNLSQLMIFIESDNPLYGRTNNPWNLERSCGGSSGGEGAIVAAGGAPLGVGADIGGSLRVPAAFNGIYSFKPTTDRLTDTSRLDVFAGQKAIISQEGPLARSVADLDLALALMNGGRTPALPARALPDPSAIDVRGLRVGFYEQLPTFAASPALARAAREAAATLEKLGAHVVPFAPPRVEDASDLFYGIMSADRGAGALLAVAGDEQDPRVAELFGIASKPRAFTSAVATVLGATGQAGLQRMVRNYGFNDTRHYWKLVEAMEAYKIIFENAMDASPGGPLDLIVAPPIGLCAIRHGASADVSTAGPYAFLYNLLGYPAGTMPWTRVRAGEETARKRSRDRVENGAFKSETGSVGLPAGVQIVGRPWREDQVFAAMYALEAPARANADFPLTPVTPAI